MALVDSKNTCCKVLPPASKR